EARGLEVENDPSEYERRAENQQRQIEILKRHAGRLALQQRYRSAQAHEHQRRQNDVGEEGPEKALKGIFIALKFGEVSLRVVARLFRPELAVVLQNLAR